MKLTFELNASFAKSFTVEAESLAEADDIITEMLSGGNYIPVFTDEVVDFDILPLKITGEDVSLDDEEIFFDSDWTSNLYSTETVE